MSLAWHYTNAQLVDGVLGQKRTTTQVLLREFRILNYGKDKVVYNINKGIHQTVLYKNDTCTQFYWAVLTDKLEAFKQTLVSNGYRLEIDESYTKDSLELTVRPLNSGKATLFLASLSKTLKGNREASGKRKQERKEFNLEALPLLQQAILAEENDTTQKKPKNPRRHWIEGKYGKVSILGNEY